MILIVNGGSINVLMGMLIDSEEMCNLNARSWARMH